MRINKFIKLHEITNILSAVLKLKTKIRKEQIVRIDDFA